MAASPIYQILCNTLNNQKCDKISLETRRKGRGGGLGKQIPAKPVA